MRRSICYCEPSCAIAGERGTWRFLYTPSNKLTKGSVLRFDIRSNGREIDWELPSCNLKGEKPVIYLQTAGGKIVSATEIESQNGSTQFQFVLPEAASAGETLTIVLGAPPGKTGKSTIGLRAQAIAQRRRTFLLYVNPTGKGEEEPEIFSIDVLGGALSRITILAPSFVLKNKRFDIVARFEDAHGNLTNDAPEDTLIELSHEHLRENLNWKLFVPETGFLALPNLYFNESGFYTIQLINKAKKQAFRSPPIYCSADNTHHLYWGMLHGESDRFDSTDNIENCLRHFRDDKAFHFYGISPFESIEEISNEMWKTVGQHIAEFNEEGRFTTFQGMQWQGENKTEGLRCFVFSKDNRPPLRKKDLRHSSLKKIYKSFSPKEMIAIPCLTMGKGVTYNFDNFDPDFERVVEIYNAWGSSENSKKEGNLAPISSKTGIQEDAEGSIQRALQQNLRFGFVAGGLDDRGTYSGLFESDQEQYVAGLTAIIAPAQTREAMFEALYQRSCYATTGERIIVGFTLAGFPMGKETGTAQKPGLAINRHLSGYAAGTTKLKSVEIIRNGKVLKSFHPESYSFEFTYDDMTPLEKVVIHAKDKKPPFAYYYLRVIQEDGHMAWSSPIWVDYIPISQLPKSQLKRVAKPTPQTQVVKKESFIIDDDEDDGFDEDDE